LALGGRGEVEWMLKRGFVPWLVSNEWGGEEGYLYSTLKTSRYCAFSAFIGTSDTGRNYRWVPVKPNSGALSVVSTPGRYYRGPGKNLLVKPYRYYRPGVGTTNKGWEFKKRGANVHVSTRVSSNLLRSSPKALLASFGNQFASPFIVRCFLYSNSKSKIN
jgi:hypothetical protein